jgi:hypothetical protein
MRQSSVGLALGLLLMAFPSWAATTEKHSGILVAADPTQQTITIEEMGPWRGPNTSPIRRVFRLASTTKIAVAERTQDGNLGWPWAFTERSLEPSQLRAGDHVTVMTEQEGRRADVVRVEVVRPASGAE